MHPNGYQHEHEAFLGGIVSDITGGSPGSPLHPTREMELAGELLGARGDHEFERFVDNVYSAVGETTGRAPGPETGQSLGAILKDAARRALPVLARALGDKYGRASQWTHLAEAAGSLLGLELEGLSPQDQEFEAARQFVRFASAAAEHAAAAPPSLSPDIVAQAAATAAAHRFAPGIAHEVAVDHRRPSGRARPSPVPAQRQWSGASPRAVVVRDHRQAAASRPQYARPATTYWNRPAAYPRPTIAWGRPTYAPGRPAWQWPRYGTPGAWGQGYGGWWGRPWARPGGVGGYTGWWQGRYPGSYGVSLPGGWGWQRGGWGLPSYDWSRFRVFSGDAPPGAPVGAPGRWVYRGRHRGRRRWAWVPYPDAQPFVAPPQPPESGPPDDGGFPTIEEPAPSMPPDQVAAPPPDQPLPTAPTPAVDPTAAVGVAPQMPLPDQPVQPPAPSFNGGAPATPGTVQGP